MATLRKSHPWSKLTIISLVNEHLRKKYAEGNWDRINFAEVSKLVKDKFPESKFNPCHLTLYKHKFLLKLDYVRMKR